MTDLQARAEAAADAYEALYRAREAMNAAVPGNRMSTPAERALYDERYKADHAAEREHHRTAIRLAQSAREIANALQSEGWRAIETAPYVTRVEIRAGSMTFIAELHPGVSEDEDGNACDQWAASIDGEHPPCWTDGGCWASNANEMQSLQPTAWRPAPPEGEGGMRIILDVDDVNDASKALSLALEQQRRDDGGDFGYWSAADPDFSAYVRATKTGVSVKGRRKRS